MSLRPDVENSLMQLMPQPSSSSQNENWLFQARIEAEKRLEKYGLPARRDEYWKYTDPMAFLSHPQKIVGAPNSVPALRDGSSTIIIDNAKLQGTEPPPICGGIIISRLQDKTNTNLLEVANLYGKLETAANKMIPRGLAIANSSRAQQGLLISCESGSQQSIQILHSPKKSDISSVQHHVIIIQPGAELFLSESGSDAPWTNVVYEIHVREGASFHLERALVGNQDPSAHLCSVFADVEEGGCINLFGLSAWSPWVRNESVVRLKGDNAKANLAGAVLGGKNCHHDDTVLVIHEGQNCESRQVYKKVLQDGAKGVFQGKILVRPNAQKTDGYQISQALLLDDKSQFLGKPELEIYADDVACSHGSTSGGVDEDAMFYLRSRGIESRQAEELLALAFLADSINEVQDEKVRKIVNQLASKWFSEGP